MNTVLKLYAVLLVLILWMVVNFTLCKTVGLSLLLL